MTQTDKKEVINLSSKHILSKIDKASLEQATNLIKKYKLNDSSISFSNQLSGILLEKSIGGKKDLSVIDVVNALKSLSAVESDAKNVLPSKYQIAVLKITSEYSKELKIATSKILESPTTDINKAAKSPYIITVQSRIISLDRTDDEVKKIQSKYKSSSTMVQNSKYSRYQNEYQIAKDDLDRWNQDMETLKQWRRDAEAKHRADQAEARAQQQSYNNNNTSFNCTSNSYGYNTTTNCRQSNSYSGWGAMNAASASAGSSFANALNTWGYNDKVNEGNRAIASARQRMNSARSKLNSTPSQISKDTFTSYSFSTRTFDVTKNIERVVFLINNNLNTYSVFTIPHQEKKTFVFVNSLDRNDKTHRQNDYQNDDDIEIFVNKPDSFSIEQLIAMIPEEHQTKELEAPIEQVLQSIQYAFNEVTKNSNGNQELSQESSTTSQPESSNSDDYIEKIKEAKLLLEAGIISEEEFEEIKKKIIDNI